MNRKDIKTAQIIKAATQEFLEKGLDAASMHHIAETAEVSKRTLYKYFPTKDALYSALIDELLESMQTVYQLEYDPEVAIREQLEKIVDLRIKYITSEAFLNMSRIVIGEILKSRRPTDEQLNRINRSEHLFTLWVAEAQKDKQIRSTLESHIIAEQFHSIIQGQVFFPVLFRFASLESIKQKNTRKMAVDFFINAYCR